jgi:hypothetical protein
MNGKTGLSWLIQRQCARMREKKIANNRLADFGVDGSMLKWILKEKN